MFWKFSPLKTETINRIQRLKSPERNTLKDSTTYSGTSTRRYLRVTSGTGGPGLVERVTFRGVEEGDPESGGGGWTATNPRGTTGTTYRTVLDVVGTWVGSGFLAPSEPGNEVKTRCPSPWTQGITQRDDPLLKLSHLPCKTDYFRPLHEFPR